MSEVINLEVLSSTKSKNGGFINKLQNKSEISVETPFGNKTQTQQTTYYMKTDTQAKVGFKADLDVAQFDVVERMYTVEDESSDLHGQEIPLKWLQIPKQS